MQTTLTDIPTGDALPMLNAYKYDQLNRLLEARSYETGLTNNEWAPTAYNNEYRNTFSYDANGNILTQNRYLRNGTTQADNLTYHYLVDGTGNLLRNRLYHVNDAIAGAAYTGDLEDQGALNNSSDYNFENLNNYRYDEEGRLIQDLAEGIEQIVWRVDGKVKKVIFTSASGKNNLEFDYDAFGRRIAKHVLTQGNVLVKSTYYILDAQGNQLSTYEHSASMEGSPETYSFELAERVMYGSSRLGINVNKVDLFGEPEEDYLNLTLGNKLFEMSNHLGNVLTVINDIKVPYLDGSDVAYYATIVSTADYSPFGVQLDGRTVSAESYRYGFNGMEKDDELKGAGNSYDFGARILDPRLGRWLSRDPAASHYQNLSPYSFVANSVLLFVDPSGCVIEIAPGLSAEKQEAAQATLNKLAEDKPYLYKYFNELKYHGDSKKFVSPGEDGYNDKQAFAVVIHITIDDIDDIDGETERQNAHQQGGTTISMTGGAEMHLEGQVTRTDNWEQGKTSKDNSLYIRHPDGTTEQIEITSPEHAREIDNMLNTGVLKATNLTNRIDVKNLSESGGAHAVITLDDFISGGMSFKAKVLAHELGHIEGWINNPIESIFFGSCNAGHCEGYSGGENATDRETNDKN